jgi:hypothetical protein
MHDPRIQRLRLTCALGFLATALAAIALCALLVPAEKRSGTFWLRLSWVSFLMATAWSGIYVYLCTPLRTDAVRKGMAGLAPAIAFGSISFAVVSLLLLGAQSLFLDNEFLSRLLLASQFVLGAVAFVVALLLAAVRVYTEPRRSNVKQAQQAGLTDKEVP